MRLVKKLGALGIYVNVADETHVAITSQNNGGRSI